MQIGRRFRSTLMRNSASEERPMHAFTQDLRFAFRQLRKSPGLTLTIVLALALGIGATTAVFSLAEGILLRPLPFRDPERLVLLGDHLGNSPNLPTTAPEVRTYERATTAFSPWGRGWRRRWSSRAARCPKR